jgi:hypothetical protein
MHTHTHTHVQYDHYHRFILHMYRIHTYIHTRIYSTAITIASFCKLIRERAQAVGAACEYSYRHVYTCIHMCLCMHSYANEHRRTALHFSIFGFHLNLYTMCVCVCVLRVCVYALYAKMAWKEGSTCEYSSMHTHKHVCVCVTYMYTYIHTYIQLPRPPVSAAQPCPGVITSALHIHHSIHGTQLHTHTHAHWIHNIHTALHTYMHTPFYTWHTATTHTRSLDT